MFPKRLVNVSANDILQLVAAGTRESDTMDFKRDLPGPSDDQKIKFLRNITAMANRLGGDILFGVTEEDAVAKDVVGLDRFAFDETEPRIRNLIANCVEPNLHGIEVQMIVGFEHGKPVVIVEPSMHMHPPRRSEGRCGG